MKACFCAALLGLALVVPSWAKTVALWPLDTEQATWLNARCLVEPGHNLSAPFGSLSTNEAFAATVPNPDATANLLDNPTNNAGSARMVSNRYFHNSGLGWKVNLTNSFTVEGWYKAVAEPTPTDWQYLVGPRGSNTGGWMLSLRSIGGQVQFSLYVRNGDATVLVNDHFFSGADLTGDRAWRHLALTYARDTANGVWSLFLDGAAVGSVTNSAAPLTQGHGNFYLGGRADHAINGFLDTWRVSDTVLAPEQMLNHPVEAPPATVLPKTVAYWRLDSQNGTLNLKSFVNSAYTLAAQGAAPLATNAHFAGTLPNSDKSADFIGNARTNSGSVCYDSAAASRYLRAPNLGYKVDLTNSFTVEGWVRRTVNPGANFYYVAGARDGGTGWMLSLRSDNGSIRYHLHANRGIGTSLDAYFPNGNVTADFGWQHLALTYDCTLAGRGVWEFFVNGASSGALTNLALPTVSHNYSAFNLAGRPAGANTFLGLLDCWRVTDAVLTPAQFLNADVDRPIVPKTLAYWKLDSAGGTADLASSVDTRFGLFGANGGATATNIQARLRIPNPDASPDFIGNPTNHSGAVFFRAPGVEPNSRCAYASYLGLRVDPVNSFTTEGWLRLHDEATTNVFFFVTGNRRASNGWMLTLRYDALAEKTKFHLFAQSPDGLFIERFYDAADVTGQRDWKHVALVHDRAGADLGTWELFLDGTSQGTLTNNVFARVAYPSIDYELGGRIGGGVGSDSTPGCFDAWRVVDQPLTPAQFLNYGFARGTLIGIK